MNSKVYHRSQFHGGHRNWIKLLFQLFFVKKLWGVINNIIELPAIEMALMTSREVDFQWESMINYFNMIHSFVHFNLIKKERRIYLKKENGQQNKK